MPIIGLTSEEEILEKQRKKRQTLLTIILVILVLAGIWAWLTFREASLKSQIASLNGKVQDLTRQIEEKKTLKEEAQVLVTQLSNLDALIKNHIYWSRALAEIEKNTLKTAYFSKFTGDAAGKKIVLSAQVPDFTEAAKQLVVFKKAEKFTHVEISAISINTKEGKAYLGFDLTLSLAEDLLLPHLK